MRNILSDFGILFGIVCVCIYLCFGGVVDVITKIIAAAICAVVIAVCVLALPFLARNPKLKCLSRLYDYGGQWEFNGDNYYITSKLLNKYFL